MWLYIYRIPFVFISGDATLRLGWVDMLLCHNRVPAWISAFVLWFVLVTGRPSTHSDLSEQEHLMLMFQHMWRSVQVRRG